MMMMRKKRMKTKKMTWITNWHVTKFHSTTKVEVKIILPALEEEEANSNE